MKPTDLFHYISYLQYPCMLIGLYFAVEPFWTGFESPLESFNNTLIFMGLGISFSTLQDTRRTQNEFSRKVWEDPRKGKFFLGMMSFTTLLILLIGLIAQFSAVGAGLREIAFGLIVLSIGLIGMIKAALEMFENHRRDRQGSPNS